MIYRPHTPADYPHIARLRWLLKSEDAGAISGSEFDAFSADYVRHLAARDAVGDTVHWLAESDGEVVGVMTLRSVEKEPSPGKGPGAIGYLTNCYVVAEHRNAGAGSALLGALSDSACREDLELLIVWPSERAYPFYRRAGFRGTSDPLELMLAEE